MNMTDNLPESMTAETSRMQSMYDITARYDRKQMLITLDLRQLPSIKIDAIARLQYPRTQRICTDLGQAMSSLEWFLFSRYNNVYSQHVVNTVRTNGYYEIDMYCEDWQRLREPFELIKDLKAYLRDVPKISMGNMWMAQAL